MVILPDYLKKKTFYGETLDSLGADIFYFFVPTTIGIYLFNIRVIEMTNYDPIYVVIIGFLTSFFLIFLRYLGSKRYVLSLLYPNKNQIFNKKKKIKNLKKLRSKTIFFENEVLRGNFFSEPGMILNFFILIYFEQTALLELYLLTLLLYYFILFLKAIISSVVYFNTVK